MVLKRPEFQIFLRDRFYASPPGVHLGGSQRLSDVRATFFIPKEKDIHNIYADDGDGH